MYMHTHTQSNNAPGRRPEQQARVARVFSGRVLQVRAEHGGYGRPEGIWCGYLCLAANSKEKKSLGTETTTAADKTRNQR